jgi:hypothetical protein
MSVVPGVPNIRVIVREAASENLIVDVPNINVTVIDNDQYNVNIVPNSIVPIRTGSFSTYADQAGNAYTASYAAVAQTLIGTIESASFAITASYALNASATNTFPFTGSAAISGSLTVTDSIVASNITASVQSSEFQLNAGTVSIIFTGSVNQGIFGVSEYVQPYISTIEYSGATIEYMAQRPGASRMGIIMATWTNNSNIIFTDVSTADVGDTSDISFAFIPSSSYYRLRVNSSGLGSGTWTVQSLFKLFPNLT